MFEDIYEYCDVQELEVDTLIHEVGAAQMEINFMHGDPLNLADRVFLFKRTVREAALRHKMYATFMAKPMENEPGSAMHVHQSLVDEETGRNLFTGRDGEPTSLFHGYIAGLQKYTPALMPIFAPYINSYRRLSRFMAAPINVQWGYDNRTVGFRIPHSAPAARRIENRIPGVDCNPYLAIAATLAAGYLGMTQHLEADRAAASDGYALPYQLPRNLEEGLTLMGACEPLAEMLGEKFVQRLSRAEGNRIRSVLPRDQFVGTQAFAAARLTQPETRHERQDQSHRSPVRRAPPPNTARSTPRITSIRFPIWARSIAAGSRVIVKAEGVYLWDSDGNRIIDGMAGLWCVNVGYGRKRTRRCRVSADAGTALLQHVLQDDAPAGHRTVGAARRTHARAVQSLLLLQQRLGRQRHGAAHRPSILGDARQAAEEVS